MARIKSDPYPLRRRLRLQEALRVRALVEKLKPGPERDVLLRKVRHLEMAAEWLSFPVYAIKKNRS